MLYILLICRKSKIINVKPLKSSWKKKQEDKMNKKLLKAYEQELKETSNKEKEVCITIIILHVNRYFTIKYMDSIWTECCTELLF